MPNGTEAPPAFWNYLSIDIVKTAPLDSLLRWLETAENKYHIVVPDNFPEMSVDELRQWIIDQILNSKDQTMEEYTKEQLKKLDLYLLKEQKKQDDETRQQSLNALLREYSRTDLANSNRFVKRYGRNSRYSFVLSRWFVWNGIYWEVDNRGLIIELAKDVSLRIADEAKLIETEEARQEMFKWCASTQAGAKIESMVKLSRSSLAILPEEMDLDKSTINFPNCTLEIPSFKKRTHNREDYCTKVMGVEYDPEAKCPLWLEHLELIFNNDKKFINEFKLMCGYSLLYDNPEQNLFIPYGSGKNGKSVTLKVISNLFNNYSVNTDPESLMQHKFTSANQARDDILRMDGARLITCIEGDRSAKLSESLVKRLTGGDTITVRGNYGTPQEIGISAKIWFATNHMPRIDETTEAIWRRLWPIPFTVTIPEDKRDKNIIQKLQKEGSGIVNWILEGVKEYYALGCQLPMPDAVKNALNEYRKTSDRLGVFFSSKVVVVNQADTKCQISKKRLYELYEEHCNLNGVEPVGKNIFGRMMDEKGFKDGVDSLGSTRIWKGIRVSMPTDKFD